MEQNRQNGDIERFKDDYSGPRKVELRALETRNVPRGSERIGKRKECRL